MSRKRTPDQEPQAETSTAVAEPPPAANDNAPAMGDNQPSFAERVGQRKRIIAADPFGIAHDNNLADAQRKKSFAHARVQLLAARAGQANLCG